MGVGAGAGALVIINIAATEAAVGVIVGAQYLEAPVLPVAVVVMTIPGVIPTEKMSLYMLLIKGMFSFKPISL